MRIQTTFLATLLTAITVFATDCARTISRTPAITSQPTSRRYLAQRVPIPIRNRTTKYKLGSIGQSSDSNFSRKTPSNTHGCSGKISPTHN